MVRAPWVEQLGGAQDQQRRGEVSALEQADPEEQPAETGLEYRPHLQT